MSKSIILMGMGPGLSMGIAERFGAEGYTIDMIGRTPEKLANLKMELAAKGVAAEFTTADASDPGQIRSAIERLLEKFPPLEVLQYNAVRFRWRPILEDAYEELSKDIFVNVASLFEAAKTVRDQLAAVKGSILVTGGGSAMYPDPDFGSLSLAKAVTRNIVHQLHLALKEKGIYVRLLSVAGMIDPKSEKHSPENLADQFW